MPWNYDKAQQRIAKAVEDAPSVSVSRFADQYMPLYESRKMAMATGETPLAPPLFNLQKGEAVVVDSIHLYINLCNYDTYLIENGQETETSHEKALSFLHLYYSACDRVAEQGLVQRVDFHGGRMHAVIIDQKGGGITQEHIASALEFVEDFKFVANAANDKLAQEQFKAEFRIGIDSGKCVVINNGSGHEQEPLFLGNAANYAAKLAEGDEPGIYISNNMRAMMYEEQTPTFEGQFPLSRQLIESTIVSRGITGDGGFDVNQRDIARASIINAWRGEITENATFDPAQPNFSFHTKEPPLKTIDYGELMPSNSIRMQVVSLFADISGYTKFIDQAIYANTVADAVKALYVFREEFQNVLEQDFGGRKIRFIGDCIHGVLAEGTKSHVDSLESVTESAKCSGGLRGSFEMCQQHFKETDQLGLSVGIEIGFTPITRLGIRGERSVRLSSSLSSAASEKCQQDCGSNQTKFGPKALGILPRELADIIDSNGVAEQIEYDDIMTCLSTGVVAVDLPAPAILSSTKSDYGRAHMEGI